MDDHPEESSKHSEDKSRHSEGRSRHPKDSSRNDVKQTGFQNFWIGGDFRMRDFTQIGIQYVQKLPLPLVLAFLLLLISGFGYLSWYLWNLIPFGPTEMRGIFNVAVAEFGEEDKNKRVRKSKIGERLSGAVYEILSDQKKSGSAQGLQIWHNWTPKTERRVNINYIRGDSETKQTENAEDKAKKINAHLLIYGNIDSNSEFRPKFVISSGFQGPDLMLGDYALKKIQINKLHPARQYLELTERTTLLFWLIDGLAKLNQNETEDATKSFEKANEIWKEIAEEGGEEKDRAIVHFFIGESELFPANWTNSPEDFNKRINRAKKEFDEALEINPNYIRSQIGLGDIYLIQAIRLLGEHTHGEKPSCEGVPCTKEILQNFIDPAIKEYKKALGIAKDSDDVSWSKGAAPFVIGMAYSLKGEAYLRTNNDREADKYFGIAIDNMETSPKIFFEKKETRPLGQVYLALGNAYRQKAGIAFRARNKERSKELLQSSIKYYESCESLPQKIPEELPYDEIFTKQIVKHCKSGISLTKELNHE